MFANPNQENDDDCSKTKKLASILLLCGLPASGKSTLASLLCSSLQSASIDNASHTNTPDVQMLYDEIVLIDYDALTNNEKVQLEMEQTTLVSEKENGDHVDEKETKIQRDEIMHLQENNETFNIDKNSITTDQSRDDLIEEDIIYASYSKLERLAWRKARRTALEILDKTLHSHFSSSSSDAINNILFVMDDNFHLRSMRREIYRLCQNRVYPSHNKNSNENNNQPKMNDDYHNQISFSTVFVDVSMKECLERNQKRFGSARVPDSVISKMSLSMEQPVSCQSHDVLDYSLKNNKHKWEKPACTCVINDVKDPNSIPNIRQCLYRSIHDHLLTPPVKEEPMDLKQFAIERAKTMKNMIHNADQLLRQLVGVTCRSDKTKAKQANTARKTILENVRNTHPKHGKQDLETRDIFLQIMKNALNQYLVSLGLDNLELSTNDGLYTMICDTYLEFVKSRENEMSDA